MSSTLLQDAAPLWTPDDLSTYLGVPAATLYAWRTRGKGPAACRVGRHLRYRQSDVASWLAGQVG